jgi:hypothetical protein
MKIIFTTTAILGLAACGGTTIGMGLDDQGGPSSGAGVVSTSGGMRALCRKIKIKALLVF